MEHIAYVEMAEIEDAHWWFSARRLILEREIQRLNLPPRPRILEVGAGTGGNLGMLSKFGEVTAVEADAFARQSAEARTGQPMLAGSLPDAMPAFDKEFDLICLFDVLEHVEQSQTSLRVMAGLLNRGGRLMISVPAYMWLWTAHDTSLHHFRRYTVSRLADELASAGLAPQRLTYYNTLLFPLAVIDRLFARFRRGNPAGMKIPAAPVNKGFRRIFASEASWLCHGTLPFGLSVLAVSTKS